MHLVFMDTDAAFCHSMQNYLSELPVHEGVHKGSTAVLQGDYQQLEHADCLICPANSFGLPDREYYGRMIDYLGEGLARQVQSRILNDYCGELPVGTAVLVETGSEQFPYVAYTPIMRVAMPISYMDNVYYGLWGALLAIRNHNLTHPAPIEHVICPSMGTGVGKVPPAQSARQLSLAYRNFVRPPHQLEWHGANNRQQEVRYGGDAGFSFPPEWA